MRRGGIRATCRRLNLATLTGAARVALGPELPALFSNHDAWADDLLAHGRRVHDPLRRLPLWAPYRRMLQFDRSPPGTPRVGKAQGLRALVSRPEFIVCDEPISSLDVSVQAQVLNRCSIWCRTCRTSSA